MATNFTPGPWAVEDPMDFELTIVEAHKPTHEWRFIANCSLPDPDDYSEPQFGRMEVEANARLIGAAPDLYAALGDAYRFITQPLRMSKSSSGVKSATYSVENFNALTAKLRAALAKARGEQS